MEAEAQCAYLNDMGLVDAVVTEDSDAFLFGAKTVYRNIFADGNFAEKYDSACVESELGIGREHLIQLALLLGSDYTVGVRGVGIVNAMEILEAFPGVDGLAEFKAWAGGVTLSEEEPDEAAMGGRTPVAVKRRFCWKHRNMKRNWTIPGSFPNQAVIDAYWNPEVDTSRKPFTWRAMNVGGLSKFCWDKFGWDARKFDEVMRPVLERAQAFHGAGGRSQRLIEDYFNPYRFAKIRSERLQRAVRGIAGDSAGQLMAERADRPASQPGVKRKRAGSKPSER
jgi:DNA excision repair protein ERCC-5